jgi:hypothetical protein
MDRVPRYNEVFGHSRLNCKALSTLDVEGQLLRARIVLDSSTTVDLYEKPKDIDFYDSTVVVSRQGQESRSYNIGNLIKHQALSLAHVAIVPSGDGAGFLAFEYEGGAVGAREGFAVLRFSPSVLELHNLWQLQWRATCWKFYCAYDVYKYIYTPRTFCRSTKRSRLMTMRIFDMCTFDDEGYPKVRLTGYEASSGGSGGR